MEQARLRRRTKKFQAGRCRRRCHRGYPGQMVAKVAEMGLQRDRKSTVLASHLRDPPTGSPDSTKLSIRGKTMQAKGHLQVLSPEGIRKRGEDEFDGESRDSNSDFYSDLFTQNAFSTWTDTGIENNTNFCKNNCNCTN